MIITTNEQKQEFKPVSLTITFQTQDELDKFTAIFNYTQIVEAFKCSQQREYQSLRCRCVELGADEQRYVNQLVEDLS